MSKSTEQQCYTVFRKAIDRLLHHQECLPSLPAITLKIRKAISEGKSTSEQLALLIGSDPALSALLMKSISSPLYRTASPPNTLTGVISVMGLAAVNNIVMAHSINSLFVLQSPDLKKLFDIARQRQLIKAAISAFLANQLAYRPADKALMVSLLSEVGSLALLSAFKDMPNVPDTPNYLRLCRHYNQPLSSAFLRKWNVEKELIEIVKQCSHWGSSQGDTLSLADIINLAFYHTIKSTSPKTPLPLLQTLPAYQKLSAPNNRISDSGLLHLVAENQEDIKAMIQMLR